jgi:hypothetical protein
MDLVERKQDEENGTVRSFTICTLPEVLGRPTQVEMDWTHSMHGRQAM